MKSEMQGIAQGIHKAKKGADHKQKERTKKEHEHKTQQHVRIDVISGMPECTGNWLRVACHLSPPQLSAHSAGSGYTKLA
jgi:hypothetical protein